MKVAQLEASVVELEDMVVAVVECGARELQASPHEEDEAAGSDTSVVGLGGAGVATDSASTGLRFLQKILYISHKALSWFR